MARERFKLTDEDLKQRWIEWGCEEEIVDQIIARITYSSHYFFQLHWIKMAKKPLNAKT